MRRWQLSGGYCHPFVYWLCFLSLVSQMHHCLVVDVILKQQVELKSLIRSNGFGWMVFYYRAVKVLCVHDAISGFGIRGF